MIIDTFQSVVFNQNSILTYNSNAFSQHVSPLAFIINKKPHYLIWNNDLKQEKTQTGSNCILALIYQIKKGKFKTS